MFPPQQSRREIALRMAAAAEHLRLPFRSRNWKGGAGNLLGAGVGSSIDFQDHRPYLPGDDPRHIDWRAYARTGAYTMKLYREEVSPLVDLVLDASRSMFFEEGKASRAWEALSFCETSARQAAGSVQICLLAGSKARRFASSEEIRESDLLSSDTAPALDFSRAPWRRGSLRVVISDLLFPGAPDAMLLPLSLGQGHGIILAPFSPNEAAPDWAGNIEMEDCESGRKRLQRVDAALLGRYGRAYAQHFGLWRESARKRGVLLARLPSTPPFLEALRFEALPAGAVELA